MIIKPVEKAIVQQMKQNVKGEGKRIVKGTLDSIPGVGFASRVSSLFTGSVPKVTRKLLGERLIHG